MSFKNQSVFSSVYTNTIFTITEDMQLSEVVIELQSGSATLLGGLQVPGLTLDPVALTVGQPVVLNADSGYTLTDIRIDSSAGGVFEIYGTYQYIDAVDASAAAYFTATGITGATQQAAIDNLVKSLKGYGLWSKMKAIYPFVTDNRNLLGYTEDLSNSAWSKDGATVNANNTIAPDGTNSAWRITRRNSATQGFAIRQSVPVVAATQYTFSVYLKAPDLSTTVLVDLGDGMPSPIITLTTEWQLYTFVRSLGGSGAFIDFNIGSGDGSYCWFWHPQLELGSTATTYQPILTTQQAFISNQFKYNLKDPRDLDAAFRLVFSGGWTFSTTGALPNGTNGYADTKLNPFLNNITTSSAHLSYYARTQSTTSDPAEIANYQTGSNIGLVLQSKATGNLNRYFYNVFNAASRSVVTAPVGYMLGSSISNTRRDLYFNGTSVANNTITDTAIMNNYNLFLGAGNINNSSVASYTNSQSAFATIGEGLTDTEAANLYIAVQTYQEALSRQVGVPVVSDPNAQAFIDAAQITDVTQADAINNLVLGLKYDNLWNKMTAIYPFVGGTASTHKFNLKDPRDLDAAYRLVFNGGWTHSSTGATPNGTNGYADTFFTQTSMGMFANSHMSYYARTVASTTGTKVEMGVGTGFANSYSNLGVGYSGIITINAGSRTIGVSTVDARGYVINSATSTSLKLYKNASLLGTDSASQLSSPSAFSLIIGAQSNGASRGNYTDRESSFATIGSGLTDADASNLYNRVQTYQTTLGRQVS